MPRKPEVKKPLQDRGRVYGQTNQNDAWLIVEVTNVAVEETHDSSVAPENWQPDEMAAAQVLVEQSTTTGATAARVGREESLTGKDLEDF